MKLANAINSQRRRALGRFGPVFSSYLKLFRGSEQLQQIMGHTYQQPFRFDLLQATQEKLSKAANVFDLGKDWFHDHFSFTKHLTPGLASQLVPHLLLNSGVGRQNPPQSTGGR